MKSSKAILLYCISFVLLVIGLVYAFVPLYQLFCQLTGYGGTTQIGTYDMGSTENTGLKTIRVQFQAETNYNMPWTFTPTQNEISVIVGEPALTFYTANNNTTEPITGVATYNVVPDQAGLYFNKIQCFCFEEQCLDPHESIEMPVLFFIHEDILDDPTCADLKTLTLAYTFFKKDDYEANLEGI